MKNNVCFSTVIFDQNFPYFKDFLISIAEQTYKEFTLLLFNDGVPELNTLLLGHDINYEIVNLNPNNSIAQNRTQMLNYLKQSTFEYCVFGDSDDYFPANRVEKNIELLKEYDIVTNNICLVNNNKKVLIQDYFQLQNKTIIDINYISNKNCCGLGNTSVRIKALPDNVSFEIDIAAIDWLLFSRMLIEHKTAIFTSETYIYYRQHDMNAIGFKTIDEERILKGIEVKKKHYEFLHKEYGIFKNLLQDMVVLIDYCSLKDRLKIYLNKILSLNIENPMWWEEIKTLEELKK